FRIKNNHKIKINRLIIIFFEFTIILIKFNRYKENREHKGYVLCYNFN
ncbi:hypothetical protein A5819_000697, partial [Enterococcus sp. 7E2_DIV0204]